MTKAITATDDRDAQTRSAFLYAAQAIAVILLAALLGGSTAAAFTVITLTVIAVAVAIARY